MPPPPPAPARPRNFIISYSGRVGSTALIDTLKMMPGFLVPVFEELDYWWLEKEGKLDVHNHENIHSYVEFLFRNSAGKVDMARTSVGFKWRIWGNISELIPVLRGNDVVVLNMMRGDILEFISSLYITNVINKEFNAPQFMLRDAATEEERLRILFRYRMQRYSVDVGAYFDLYSQQLDAERKRIEILREMHGAGVPVLTLLYEDFAYKRFRFLKTLLSALGHPPPAMFPTLRLQKVSSSHPSESFDNLDELKASGRLMPMLYEWDRLVYDSGLPMMPM